MPRRIEIELTSSRDDGTWTWRAAGARQPKGDLDGKLLYEGAKVGDVVRADCESDLDGILVLEVLPPKGARKQPELLELLGSGKSEELVTSTLVKGRRGGRDGDRRGGGRRDGRGGGGGRGGDRDGGRGRRDDAPRPDARPKPKRLRPGRVHRKELVESLPPEQQPIADQLIRGGLPAVRAAVDKQNEQAKQEGRPEISPEPLVGLAEQLAPRVRAAEWRDRADAAVADLAELDLKDLRSVVVAGDSDAKDDESRAIAAQLREGLSARVEKEHADWLSELADMVNSDRTVAALRRSSRPPKAGSPLPTELAQSLAAKASAGLTAETGQDRWAIVLDALAYSPVRTSVIPESLPANPSDELLTAIRKLSMRIPEIAALFGIEPTPPPRDHGRGRGGRSGGARSSGGAKIPPPPKLEAPKADVAAPADSAAPAAPEVAAAGGAAEESPAPAVPTPDAVPTEPEAAKSEIAPASPGPAPDAVPAQEAVAPSEDVEKPASSG